MKYKLTNPHRWLHVLYFYIPVHNTTKSEQSGYKHEGIWSAINKERIIAGISLFLHTKKEMRVEFYIHVNEVIIWKSLCPSVCPSPISISYPPHKFNIYRWILIKLGTYVYHHQMMFCIPNLDVLVKDQVFFHHMPGTLMKKKQ